jgi:hypothetical protein
LGVAQDMVCSYKAGTFFSFKQKQVGCKRGSKIAILCLLILGVVESTGFTQESNDSESKSLDFRISQWNMGGTFDYFMHYPSGQLESWVSMPQNQSMTIFEITRPINDDKYIKLTYGSSGVGYKGTGADSDWDDGMPDTLWYYGNMDFYGQQQLFSIDYGHTFSKKDKSQTGVYAGWNSHKTSNELRNVNYHIIDSVDVGDQTQPDNGSTLDGNFHGLHIGLEHEQIINNKLTLNGKWTTSYLIATAHGQWNNRGWIWDNTGTTIGQEVIVGANYKFNQDVSSELGYRYYYAKMTGGDEVLTSGSNIFLDKGIIDLRYMQKGVYYALNAKF